MSSVLYIHKNAFYVRRLLMEEDMVNMKIIQDSLNVVCNGVMYQLYTVIN